MEYLEGLGCDGGDQAAVGAANFLPHDLARVLLGGVDGHVGAEFLGERERLVADVDRDRVEAHGLGVLQAHVPQAAGTKHNAPLPRPRARLLESW